MLLYRAETLSERLLNMLRLPVAALLAFVVTILLFYLMQSLIESGEKALSENHLGNIVEFTRIKEEQFVEVKNRRLEPPPLPDEPPKIAKPRVQTIDVESWSNVFKPLDTSVQVSSLLKFLSDGEYLPILKVQPVYPIRALQKELVGWVLVEFTVNEIGKVINPIVVDHCVEVWGLSSIEPCYDRPGKIFDKPALAAASRFKYKPRVIDGQAIATAGVRNMISFVLDE